MNVMVVDIETLDWFGDGLMAQVPREAQLMVIRLGLTGVGRASGDTLEYSNIVGMDDPALMRLWAELCDADVVVSYNGDKFDLPILYKEGTASEAWRSPLRQRWPKSLDFQAEILKATNRYVKLHDVAVATLGHGKTGNGEQAARNLLSYFTNDNFQALQDCVLYNAMDVQLTWDLYRHVVQQGNPLVIPPKYDKDGRPKPGYEYEARLWIGHNGWHNLQVVR